MMIIFNHLMKNHNQVEKKDTRKHCQKCGQKGHNRVTCKTVISNVNNENTR